MTREDFIYTIKPVGKGPVKIERALNDLAGAWIHRDKSRYYRAWFEDGSMSLHYDREGRVTRVRY